MSLTPENLADRKGMITASSAPKLMAGGKTRETLIKGLAWERDNKEVATTYSSEAMMRGAFYEPFAVEILQANVSATIEGNKKLQTLQMDISVFDVDAITIGATPDAIDHELLDAERMAIFDIKVPLGKNYEKNHMRTYRWQLIFQCLVMGQEYATLAVFDFDDKSGNCVRWRQEEIHAEPHFQELKDAIVCAEKEISNRILCGEY